MPFPDKLALTQVIIERNLREMGRDCAVAFSGGKDSTLVTWLVIQLYPDIPVVFNDTGVEYPETVRFVHTTAKAWNLNLIETRPERTFWQCVDKWGWPADKRAKVSEGKNTGKKCCYWLKEKPMKLALRSLKAKGYFTGVTAVENRTRMFVARDKGTCYQTDGFRKVHPILYWTPAEVRGYLRECGLAMNPVYERGADRVGCSVCTAFLSWETQLSAVNPKLYALVKARKNALEGKLL
jgi:3'-phosphoadenosine 5'-phosphosulfate sulfotransferase (PAPS reductase)/FAD synthetase